MSSESPPPNPPAQPPAPATPEGVPPSTAEEQDAQVQVSIGDAVDAAYTSPRRLSADAVPDEEQLDTNNVNYASIDESGRDDDDEDGDISITASSAPKERTALAHSAHRRIDSVPPKKYNVEDDAADGLAASLAVTSLQSAIAEEDEESDISFPHHNTATQSQLTPTNSALPHRYGPESHDAPPAIDKADLNFVDITLDAPGPDNTADTASPSLHPFAGSGRSAEQIRRDSVSSHDVPTTSSAASGQPPQKSAPTADSPSAPSQLSPPLGSDRESTSRAAESPMVDRGVEGRYRGRRSAASSRAASPTASPSRSPSRRASFVSRNGHSPHDERSNPLKIQVPPSTAPALLAADEHGNISVVSDIPLSPRTIPDDMAREEDPGPSAAPQASHQGPAAAPEPRHEQAAAGRAAASLSEEVEAVEAAETAKEPKSATTTGNEAALALPTSSSQPPTSPGLSDKADQVDDKKRRKSSFASNASNDPVESRTRMTTLPAKPKTEEIKHRADFERMMMAAKEQERKKREEDEERKRRRQDEQRQALGRWEKEILPSWSRARKDPELAKLWWQGAPPSIRGRVWALAIGNPLMLPRNLLEQSERKAAQRGEGSAVSTIPSRVRQQIEEDVSKALPSLRLFQSNGPLHEDLVRLCRAFVLVRMEQVAGLEAAGDADQAASRHQHTSPSDHKASLPAESTSRKSGECDQDAAAGTSSEEPEAEGVYARRGIDIYQAGTASLAAVLLINMPINTAFIALLNLLHAKPWLKALYSLLPNKLPDGHEAASSRSPRKPGSAYTLPPKEKEIRGFERVLETLLADQMPKVYANLLAHNVKLYRVVLRDWVATLWTQWLDVDTVMRLWDVVLLDETDSVIYRVCLALVQTLESRLYVPDTEELESILRGTNRAALAVWRRDKIASGQIDTVLPKRASVPTSPPTTSTESLDEVAEANTGGVAIPTRNSSLASEPRADPKADEIMPTDYIYEQYAVQEHHIFDTLDAQLPTWKQSTLQRLLDRELTE